MSVMARFSVPADQFVLGEVLDATEDVHVRLESLVPTGDAVIPYVWVLAGDADAVAAAFERSSLVASARVVDETGPETLFRVEWCTAPGGLVDLVREAGGVILEGEGRGEDWSFRVRFPRHDDLSAFHRSCVDSGVSLCIDEVTDPLDATPDGVVDVTDAQREALTVALETGYFDVPRRTTLEDLATRLGISDTAASQRLRRGLSRVLSATLLQTGGERADAEAE